MSTETVATAVLAALRRSGVDTVFGYPGGAVLPLYDALVDAGLRHVTLPHEQDLGHAAEGYALGTGRLGVVVATSGPGATNLATPLLVANANGTPILAITGQVNAAAIGTMAFQEAPVTSIVDPITVHCELAMTPSKVAPALQRAVVAACQGGAALVDIPKDVLASPPSDALCRMELPGALAPNPSSPTDSANLDWCVDELRSTSPSRRVVVAQTSRVGEGLVSARTGAFPGWALPAAIGVCVGVDESTWVVIDAASFVTYARSLTTASQRCLPLRVAVTGTVPEVIDVAGISHALGVETTTTKVEGLSDLADRVDAECRGPLVILCQDDRN